MKLHFKSFGEGKPVIILHGLFGSSDNWQTLAKVIAEKYKVYLVDQRNHGHSSHVPEMDYGVMCDDLFELIQDEQLDQVGIIGHSMGGKTAMYFAQEHPELIRDLIVVDMGTKKYPPHHQVIFDALLGIDLDKVTMRKQVEEHLRLTIHDNGVIQFLLKNLYWSEKEKLDWRFNLHVLYREIDRILDAVPPGRIDVRTLFIRGEKSNYILNTDFPSLGEQFPGCEIKTIMGAGHWVHAEAPKEFLHEVMSFLS
ncbi:MAG: alpha/beta fold hydrolase [Flavobacteriales bacterium]|nr:alpha/beta fold hydrolase [Flavobacteriales bacterium]